MCKPYSENVFELIRKPLFEFNEFEPRLKSAKNRFQLSADLNLKKYNFKWNQPYLSRGLNLSRCSNSLNSASGLFVCVCSNTGMYLALSKVLSRMC